MGNGADLLTVHFEAGRATTQRFVTIVPSDGAYALPKQQTPAKAQLTRQQFIGGRSIMYPCIGADPKGRA